jgi:peptidoglycan hydrolase-like protein with peptidoglycan-binding domain
MSWTLAKSLEQLRGQVNSLSPNRDKSWDGTIGDAAHSARTSDHNADSHGVVHALDITHDPAHGIDSYLLADQIVVSRDKRVKYVISNRRISNPLEQDWKWRAYNGLNPHDHHCHVSVVSTAGLENNIDPWTIHRTDDASPGHQPPTSIPAPVYPLLKRGSMGPDVERVQTILSIKADGIFGPMTEAAVKGFQQINGLVSDGKVGPVTWEALIRAESGGLAQGTRFTSIIATEFGGAGDEQDSAYQDVPKDWASQPGCSLPARFKGERPLVRIWCGMQTIVVPIVDVGPWNINDPYWETVGGRPQAESGVDMRGRTTNRAGIDLTPPAAEALGVDGKGVVDWQFEDNK